MLQRNRRKPLWRLPGAALAAILIILSVPGWHQVACGAQKPVLEVIVVQETEDSEQVAVEVILHNPGGMAAGQLQAVYDSRHFSPLEIMPGALLQRDGFAFESNMEQEGILKLAWLSLQETPRDSTSGSLFQASFQQKSPGAPGLDLKLQHVKLLRADGSPLMAVPGEILLQVDQAEAWVDSKPALLDAAPFIREGRTMVPVRFVSEQLGAQVTWLPETWQVRITDGQDTILLTIDSPEVLLNEEEITLDTSAVIVSSRTFVPLRFVSETLGANVTWHGETRTVSIRLP